jgi:hypothetical protein
MVSSVLNKQSYIAVWHSMYHEIHGKVFNRNLPHSCGSSAETS